MQSINETCDSLCQVTSTSADSLRFSQMSIQDILWTPLPFFDCWFLTVVQHWGYWPRILSVLIHFALNTDVCSYVLNEDEVDVDSYTCKEVPPVIKDLS